ncbi:MAG: CGGC domain-containing protein [Schwartzia sp.]|nr:CGGC domain-containing protein [Schwartzia sp. (in: firmicutes)]
MKRVAIFNCHHAGETCTGSGCFKAFNQRDAFFARYQEEPAELVSFARCNGCGHDWENDESLAKKIDRLKDIADVVHFGACTVKKGTECQFITRLGTKLEGMGLEVVRGTHAVH